MCFKLSNLMLFKGIKAKRIGAIYHAENKAKDMLKIAINPKSTIELTSLIKKMEKPIAVVKDVIMSAYFICLNEILIRLKTVCTCSFSLYMCRI